VNSAPQPTPLQPTYTRAAGNLQIDFPTPPVFNGNRPAIYCNGLRALAANFGTETQFNIQFATGITDGDTITISGDVDTFRNADGGRLPAASFIIGGTPAPLPLAYCNAVEYANAAGHLWVHFDSHIDPAATSLDFATLEIESGSGTDVWDPVGPLIGISPVGWGMETAEFEGCTFTAGSRWRITTQGTMPFDPPASLVLPVTGIILNVA
jgi:hypothetical protein